MLKRLTPFIVIAKRGKLSLHSMRRLIFALLLLLAGVHQLLAVPVTGSLRGRVTSGNKALAGVRITASSPSCTVQPSTISASDGTFWLPSVPPGTWDVTFAAEGMQTLTRRSDIYPGEEDRAEISLEPSAEGENVTTTASVHQLLERPQPLFTITRDIAEALPLGRSLDALLALGPGGTLDGTFSLPDANDLDGATRQRGTRFMILDAIDTATIVTTGAPSELGAFHDRLSLVTSRRSGDRFDATARVTGEHASRGSGAQVEVTAGGIPSSSLHLFAAAASSSLRDRTADSNWLAAADAAVGPGFTVGATALGANDGNSDFVIHGRLNASADSTIDAYASDGDVDEIGVTGSLFVSAAGSHELRGGVQRERYGRSTTAVFAEDHWTAGERWSLLLGARHDGGDLLPRLGAVFDPSADGHRRIAATYDERLDSHGVKTRNAAISLGQQLDGGSWIAATLLRRTRDDARDATALMVNGSYRYLIFTLGGNATWTHVQDDLRSLNLWLIVDPPLVDQDVNLALLERTRPGFSATDLAITYTFASMRLRPFVKAEAENIFGDSPRAAIVDARGRTYRLGAGISFGAE